jgi:hypothetical protein
LIRRKIGQKKFQIRIYNFAKILGQYQDYFSKFIALSFIKIIFDLNS